MSDESSPPLSLNWTVQAMKLFHVPFYVHKIHVPVSEICVVRDKRLCHLVLSSMLGVMSLKSLISCFTEGTGSPHS